MIQRLIGSVVGALVAYIVLWLSVGSQYSSQYVTAVVIGAIATILWPLVIGWLFVRRKNKRDEQIQKEVDKQISQQR